MLLLLVPCIAIRVALWYSEWLVMKKKRTCVFTLNCWMSIPDMQVSDSLQYHVIGYKRKDYDSRDASSNCFVLEYLPQHDDGVLHDV